MSVVIDASFPAHTRDLTGGGSNFTWTAFTTPGSNRFLVAVFLANAPSGAKTISTLTSPHLTWTKRLTKIDSGLSYIVEMWTAFAASVVTSEVISQVDTAGASYNRRSFLVYSLNGADAASFGNTATATLSGAPPSIALTSSGANGLGIAGLPYRQAGSDTPVPDANTTADYYSGDSGGFAFNERSGSRALTSSGSFTLGWTDTPFEDLVIGAIEIKAAAAGGGGAKQGSSLLTCGVGN